MHARFVPPPSIVSSIAARDFLHAPQVVDPSLPFCRYVADEDTALDHGGWLPVRTLDGETILVEKEAPDFFGTCQFLADNGVVINRPPRDGRMAFVRSPDNISVELLQNGDALESAEPWVSMGNTGHW